MSNSPRSGPIELKVSAATVAAAVSSLAVWALQTYVFGGDVPAEVSGAMQVIVPAIITFVAGYLTKHTPRPDLTATPDPGGRHVLDGGPTDIPVSRLDPPSRRYRGGIEE